MEKLNWLVGHKFKASKFEPERKRVIAAFNTYVSAEDFINLVLPEETRGRFYIENRSAK